MFFQRAYINDVAILKRYGEKKYKLTICKSLPNPIYERQKRVPVARGTNDKKLDNNISRAKQKVYEYALCNDWTYFVTLTLDSKKYDRYDLAKFKKDLGKFINNYSRKWNGNKISYILIPELHEDGAWHMHGLFIGIHEDDITPFKDVKNSPIKLKKYLNWDSYSQKFGFCSLGVIKDKEKVASYIIKYISKDLNNSIKELNAKLYYNSHGLNIAEEIKRGSLSATIEYYDYENDHVKVKWLDYANTDIITEYGKN